MSKISVALCTYNGARFLSEQLASVLAQTRLPDELVVNDDRSTDETVGILREFAARAPFPVKIEINTENLGSTRNFERAVGRAAGEVIFLSDQDDVWMPQKIEKMLRALETDDGGGGREIGMVFTNAELVGERLEPLGKNLFDSTFSIDRDRRDAAAGNMFEVLLRRNVVTGATAAFRAKFREVFTPIPTDIPNTIHDGWIALVIAANSRVKYLDEPLIKYRQHAGQQLGVDWRYGREGTPDLRFRHYERSIQFFREEVERLLMMSVVLKNYPQFQSPRIQNSIEDIVRLNLEEKRELIRHLEARQNLPANRLKRVAPVGRELLSGRYARFSRKFASPVKDLLEKWSQPE